MTSSAKESKKQARLKTLIESEISAIDSAIAIAVENNKFDCEVVGTTMTQEDDSYEPTVEAQAHCKMDIWSFELDDINGQDYREGDILTFANAQSDTPTLVRVAEIDEIGNPISFEIEQEGVYDEICSESALKYADESNYLDINTAFGSDSDLRLNRNDTYDVQYQNEWHHCEHIYTSEFEPTDDFGEDNSVFVSGNNGLIKLNGKWVNANSVSPTLLSDSFGNQFDLIINMLGHNYVKIIRDETPKWYDFGEIIEVSSYPDVKLYNNGDVVFYTTHRATADYTYKLVKNNDIWYQMKDSTTYDFTGKTIEDMGDLGEEKDIVSDGTNSYFKLNNQWHQAVETYHSDSMYRNSDFGEDYDVIISGETYFVKLNGEWEQVNKVWNLNDYDIGHNESAFNITWNINDVEIDNQGDGYIYDTLVKIDGKSKLATCEVEDGKIISVSVNKKDTVYNHRPEVSFHMVGDRISEKCYQIWKKKLVDVELQDAIKQVIEHYEDLNYSVSRITNKKTGNTFIWKIRWY